MRPIERDKLTEIIRAKDKEVDSLRQALQRTHNETIKLEKQINSLQHKVVLNAPSVAIRRPDSTEKDKISRELAILRRALSLDSPGILALVQEKEKLEGELQGMQERVNYLASELDKVRGDRETLKSARELMTPRPELTNRLLQLEKENRRV